MAHETSQLNDITRLFVEHLVESRAATKTWLRYLHATDGKGDDEQTFKLLAVVTRELAEFVATIDMDAAMAAYCEIGGAGELNGQRD